MNISHVIHALSVGPTYLGIYNMLDGIVHDTSGTFKYFSKVLFASYIDFYRAH